MIQAYELALELNEGDTATRAKRDLCAALVQASMARESGDLEGERKALMTARPLAHNPAILDARIDRLDAELYEAALEKAEVAFGK